MSIDHARYGRQVRLAEIGEDGQARLEASEVVPGGAGGAREIEVLYLQRAGARVVEGDASANASASAEADAEAKAYAALLAALGVRDGDARQIADGALRALVAMRKIILGVGLTEPR